MRRLLLAAAALLAALVTASSASAAATLVSSTCNRYVPGLAAKKWVPVVATGGLAAGQSVKLEWADSSKSLAGYAQADPLGRLLTRTLMPTSFISSRGPHVRTFGLAALDATTSAPLGLGQVRFVRVDAGFQSRRRPHQVTRYGLWGAPAGRRVWMHFFFGGRERRVVDMGRADRPCGVVHKRMPVLPARSRYGRWDVYFTNSRRAPSRDARRQRRFIYRIAFTVYRIYVPRYRAAAAAVR